MAFAIPFFIPHFARQRPNRCAVFGHVVFEVCSIVSEVSDEALQPSDATVHRSGRGFKVFA